jgi:4'-phosphopantetheinyl transferase
LNGGWSPGPARPAIPRAELHVWRADLAAPGWPGVEGPPAVERERAAQMRRPGAEDLWVAARWALRGILALYLPEMEPAEIALSLDREGKPRLRETPDLLRFNLSHSGTLALVAVSGEHPVGVDVEQVRPGREPVALVERALGPEDAAAVRAAAPTERDLVFHRLWARHEARLKCVGAGIFRDPQPQTELVTVADIEVAGGYAAAVAAAAPELSPRRFWTFNPRALQKDGSGVS